MTTASDVDGGLDLLALPDAVAPETWVVTVVHTDGARTPASASGTGAGGWYPRFGSEQPAFTHWWYVDGADECHAEVHAPAADETVRVALRPTDGPCPSCRERLRAQEPS